MNRKKYKLSKAAINLVTRLSIFQKAAIFQTFPTCGQ